jgi:5'-deoxynucleotidase YfbR-like HD superfamily hydrolase
MDALVSERDLPEHPALPAGCLDILRELGELKRVRSAAQHGSIAVRLFARGWASLVAGVPAESVWRQVAGAALCATRLGDVDVPLMLRLGVSREEALAILLRALDEVLAELPAPLSAISADALREALDAAAPASDAPPFVVLLSRQPRAGVTCPGKPRILLEPPENHAEHCLMVAVYGVLLAQAYDADPATVFLAAMAHHLHNVFLPDSGFAGEVLMGDQLEPVMHRATELALAELPAPLAAAVRQARTVLPDAATPEGRAFHAADTLDRVLQIEQHLRAGKVTMYQVLHDMALVHEGPVKAFQDRLLADVGLMT